MAQSTPVAKPNFSNTAFDTLKHKLVDLVEPLSDSQLLDLADGIHDLLRQRRMVRQHHADRMQQRSRHAADALN